MIKMKLLFKLVFTLYITVPIIILMGMILAPVLDRVMFYKAWEIYIHFSMVSASILMLVVLYLQFTNCKEE